MILLPSLLLPAILTMHQTPGQMDKAAFNFMGVPYYHRYTKDNLHEFTPKGQTDLDKWTEMFTINDYASIKTGEALAKGANSVLDTYKANQAVVVRTNSIPMTAKKPAEHLIVVLFPRPDFIEVSFTRFLLSHGIGVSLVFSRRIYGEKSGDKMSSWLTSNGEKTERALMAMAVPSH